MRIQINWHWLTKDLFSGMIFVSMGHVPWHLVLLTENGSWLVKSHYPHFTWPWKNPTYTKQLLYTARKTVLLHLWVILSKGSVFCVCKPMVSFFCRQPTPALLWMSLTRNSQAHYVWTGNSTRLACACLENNTSNLSIAVFTCDQLTITYSLFWARYAGQLWWSWIIWELPSFLSN